ncbi:MAG: SPOR domain-containing protein [Gammaproteobacteria bacterium]|nr:SPOR domain-containing protein [Gammaproteobacteria bacterium]MDH5304359.1 SPOR domain-containing protein [Gammaproteobacteria bacterium]MDH5323002.1 SPOR domain-containing protein [Gammaproteobacteria bacterium]
MANRKRRRSARSSRSQQQSYPGWMWMLFGLAIGLSVAFAVHVKDRGSAVRTATPQAATAKPPIDRNGEQPAAEAQAPSAETAKEPRFTFYTLLPDMEVTVPGKLPDSEADKEPQAIVEPGIYVLQAGSFSTFADAERRRAELGMQGISSHIQRVQVNDRNYHRVYIGPTEDLDELNMLRSRLRAAKIDVLRIRLSD